MLNREDIDEENWRQLYVELRQRVEEKNEQVNTWATSAREMTTTMRQLVERNISLHNENENLRYQLDDIKEEIRQLTTDSYSIQAQIANERQASLNLQNELNRTTAVGGAEEAGEGGGRGRVGNNNNNNNATGTSTVSTSTTTTTTSRDIQQHQQQNGVEMQSLISIKTEREEIYYEFNQEVENTAENTVNHYECLFCHQQFADQCALYIHKETSTCSAFREIVSASTTTTGATTTASSTAALVRNGFSTINSPIASSSSVPPASSSSLPPPPPPNSRPSSSVTSNHHNQRLFLDLSQSSTASVVHVAPASVANQSSASSSPTIAMSLSRNTNTKSKTPQIQKSSSSSTAAAASTSTDGVVNGNVEFGKNYPCTICEKLFYRKINLFSHMRSHRKTSIELNENPTVKRHYKRRNESFPTAGAAAAGAAVSFDLVSRSPPPPATTPATPAPVGRPRASASECHLCHQLFPKRAAFRDHLRMHKRQEPKEIYNCEICSKTFLAKCGWVNHMKIHKVVFEVSCDICLKKFPNEMTLSEHRGEHENNITNNTSTSTTHSCPLTT